MDVTDEGTTEFDMRLVACRTALIGKSAYANHLDHLSPPQPADLRGWIGEGAVPGIVDFDEPIELTQTIWPDAVGRTHTEIIPRIRIASPYVFGQPGCIGSDAGGIQFVMSDSGTSRWLHWYSEWETTLPSLTDGCVGSITTVPSAALTATIRREQLELAWLVRAKFVRRAERYRDYEADERSAWLQIAPKG